MNKYYRCYAEVSLRAIRHNIAEAKKRIAPGVKMLAVVKADAYGHGAVRVAHALEDLVDFFAVATVDEALELRENDISLPVLILGYTSPSEYPEMIAEDIRPSIYRVEDARALGSEAEKQGVKARMHIALDTGMTRIGFQVNEKEADKIAEIAALPSVRVEGMFTHFSCCDQQDQSYTRNQMKKFDTMVELLRQRGVEIPILHVCNSAGIMEFDQNTWRFGMVRSGIITYGVYPSEEVSKENLRLEPALQWKAHVIHVKDVGPGVGVSYGATYVTDKPVTRIATVSAGYADGYPRALSSKGRVLIRGQYAPILGRICMDQMMVDVSDIPDVQVEDVVTLIGRDGDGFIPVEDVADPAGRFNYEMLCGISPRVVRLYDEDQ
jgi:alanine racemase